LSLPFFTLVSPWLVFNARLGYEVTLGYLIFNIGLYFLYLALESPKYFLLAIPVLSLSVYASFAQRYLFPIFFFSFYFSGKKL